MIVKFIPTHITSLKDAYYIAQTDISQIRMIVCVGLIQSIALTAGETHSTTAAPRVVRVLAHGIHLGIMSLTFALSDAAWTLMLTITLAPEFVCKSAPANMM